MNFKAPEVASLLSREPELFRALLQQEAILLQRLRHPQLLQLVDPLQQGSDSWVFTTKPVACLLDKLLRDCPASTPAFERRTNQLSSQTANAAAATEAPSSSSPFVASSSQLVSSWAPSALLNIGVVVAGKSQKAQLKAQREAAVATAAAEGPPAFFEIKCGLVDVAEALGFLHSNAQLLHLNLHPESVFVDTSGRWKLGGLAFAQQLPSSSEGRPFAQSLQTVPCDLFLR